MEQLNHHDDYWASWGHRIILYHYVYYCVLLLTGGIGLLFRHLLIVFRLFCTLNTVRSNPHFVWLKGQSTLTLYLKWEEIRSPPLPSSCKIARMMVWNQNGQHHRHRHHHRHHSHHHLTEQAVSVSELKFLVCLKVTDMTNS